MATVKKLKYAIIQVPQGSAGFVKSTIVGVSSKFLEDLPGNKSEVRMIQKPTKYQDYQLIHEISKLDADAPGDWLYSPCVVLFYHSEWHQVGQALDMIGRASAQESIQEEVVAHQDQTAPVPPLTPLVRGKAVAAQENIMDALKKVPKLNKPSSNTAHHSVASTSPPLDVTDPEIHGKKVLEIVGDLQTEKTEEIEIDSPMFDDLYKPFVSTTNKEIGGLKCTRLIFGDFFSDCTIKMMTSTKASSNDKTKNVLKNTNFMRCLKDAYYHIFGAKVAAELEGYASMIINCGHDWDGKRKGGSSQGGTAKRRSGPEPNGKENHDRGENSGSSPSDNRS
ncbi:hypothetical protein QAD02_003020 [Eretmocerus hayati]|uniref:Uncharacterized protein n=1 Tax=Eretmocerus hayati TaxID=131215 RepID=A0ACC2NLG7_9HYME|nr:hypothetical protein QAD02_003020 [Eretmocerus hayati]